MKWLLVYMFITFDGISMPYMEQAMPFPYESEQECRGEVDRRLNDREHVVRMFTELYIKLPTCVSTEQPQRDLTDDEVEPLA